MKIYSLLVAFVVCTSLNSTAQIQPKSNVIGGSTAFGYSGPSEGVSGVKQLNLTINPSYGRFISNKWQLSANLNYGYNQSETIYQNPMYFSKSSANTFGGGLGATRYFGITEKLYFHVDGQLGFDYTSGLRTDFFVSFHEYEFTSSLASVSFSPGFTYFPGEKWLIFANFGALRYSMQTDLDVFELQHNFGFYLNSSSISFGAGFIFGGKDK